MSTEQHSRSFLRKRKMMIVLPVLVLPFITLAFWALGGGKAAGATIKQAKNDNRLNLQLPGARLKSDKGLDKMSYYEIALADSEKLKARMRNDPYFKLKTNLNAETPDDKNNTADNDADDSLIDSSKGLNASPYNTKINTTAAETKVYDKLKQINAALDNATLWSKKAAAE